MKHAAIVVTTIFEPHFLEGYLRNVDRWGKKESVDIFVIVDRKTPASVGQACADASRRGFRVHCPTLPEQESFLARFGRIGALIPYDSDNRRNIGFLMALDAGADVLISIDDDNFCPDAVDFVGEHSTVGDEVGCEVLDSNDRWFNIGTRLQSDAPGEIFPRGFPYFARRRSRGISLLPVRARRVSVNAGLWVSDPDVDAITRLAVRPAVTAADPQPVFLGPSSWSPINTQNTAVMREAVSAYYYVRMGHSVGGLTVDRYGDIMSGYFLAKCAFELGDTIRVGPPVADHRRTPHNLFKDLYHELACMVLLDDLLPWLVETPLSGANYASVYGDLAGRLEEQSTRYGGFIWDAGGGEFLRQTATAMRAWLDAVRLIG